jgi:molybdenum cofactor cytidylyltransferase
VLMLANQPGVVPATVRVLLAARGDEPIAVCRYDDGRGYPIAVGREAFGQLRALRGEDAVVQLLDGVEEVPVAGRIPLSIDTWADYETALATSGHTPVPELWSREGAGSTGGWRRGFTT